MKFLVTLIGLILVLEGLPYAAFPDSMKAWLKQLTEMSPNVLRFFGFAAIVLGLLLCYITQKTNLLD